MEIYWSEPVERYVFDQPYGKPERQPSPVGTRAGSTLGFLKTKDDLHGATR